MADKNRAEVVTFKADPSLIEALQGVPNRSAFIRNAVLAALEHVCPLCRGTGILSPDQQRHWQAFAERHPLEQCDDCAAYHPVCTGTDEPDIHADPGA